MKYNQPRKPLETDDKSVRITQENENNREVNLQSFAIKMNSAIRNYENKRLEEVEAPELYEVYTELSMLTGLGESTIRAYSNRFTPRYPTLDKLILLCKVMDDSSPFDAYVKIGQSILGKNKPGILTLKVVEK